MLEELGRVTVTAGDGAKKLPAITAEGQACLDAYRPGCVSFGAIVTGLGTSLRAASSAPQILTVSGSNGSAELLIAASSARPLTEPLCVQTANSLVPARSGTLTYFGIRIGEPVRAMGAFARLTKIRRPAYGRRM
jgi:hypothetical protein